MRKFIVLFFLFTIFTSLIVPSNKNNDDLHEVLTCEKLMSQRNINDLWGSKINEFKVKNYNNMKGSKHIGKRYRIGIMEHRQVVEFGTQMKLKTKEIERLTDTYAYGTVKNITLSKSKSYNVINEITISNKIKVGIAKMISAGFNFLDIANYGTETNFTTEYDFRLSKVYSESLTENYAVSVDLDLSNLLPGKLTFSLSRIALIIEIPLLKSYTEENKMFQGWKRLENTLEENYFASYYIEDICTFAYNDNTFGNKPIGEYSIDNTIKNY